MSLKYARFADLGLILQALGGFFLLDGKTVSPLVIFVTILVAWVYHRGVLLPALRHHANTVRGDEKSRIVGLQGRVTSVIDPVGTVYVGGESWTARSTEPIMPDVEVIVTDKIGLELRVEKAKREERTNGQYN
jgi:membrane-bound ClpP family serine protease